MIEDIAVDEGGLGFDSQTAPIAHCRQRFDTAVMILPSYIAHNAQVLCRVDGPDLTFCWCYVFIKVIVTS